MIDYPEPNWRGTTTPLDDAMEKATKAAKRFAKVCESLSEAIWRVPGLAVTGLCVGPDGRMGCERGAM